MTQHVLNDALDPSIFNADRLHLESDEDYRGLTSCEAGRWLQDEFNRILPEIEALILHYHDDERRDYEATPPEDRERHIFQSLRSLRLFLEIERLASFPGIAEWGEDDELADDGGIPF